MNIEALIAKRLAAPKSYRVVTTYEDGEVDNHDTETLGQAELWTRGMSVKIGKVLIDRQAKTTCRIVSVEITKL